MNFTLRIKNSFARYLSSDDVLFHGANFEDAYRFIASDCDDRGFNLCRWGGSDEFIRNMLHDYFNS